MTPRRNATVILPFLLVVALAGSLLTGDRFIHRPRAIPKPPTADSLAGVIARLFPMQADSADVARVTWYESPESWLGLNWISTDAYRYRTTPQGETAPIAAHADLKRWRITFAKGQSRTPMIVAHELGHLMLRLSDHPATTFQRIEEYRGR